MINDQIHILENQSGSSFFDADDYLDLQIDLVDASVELEQADRIARMLNSLIQSVLSSSP